MMWPYIAIVLLIAFFAFFYNKKDSNVVFLLLCIVLFLFAALRGNGNADYFTYLERAQFIVSWDDVLHKNIGMEIGYKVLAFVMNHFNLPRQCVVSSMNFISIVCFSKFMDQYSSNKYLSLLVFLPLYFQLDMHAARLAVAVAIFTLGYRFIIQRKLLKFIGIIVLASMFHITAFFGIFAYFVYGFRYRSLRQILSIAIAYISVLFLPIDRILMMIFQFVGLNTYYEKFVNYGASEYGYNLGLFDFRIIFNILIVFIASYTFRNEREKYAGLMNIFLFGTLAQIVLSTHAIVSIRLSFYYLIYSVLLVPNMCEVQFENYDRAFGYWESSGNQKIYKVLLVGVFFVYAGLFAYNLMVKGIDYKLFWTNPEYIWK